MGTEIEVTDGQDYKFKYKKRERKEDEEEKNSDYAKDKKEVLKDENSLDKKEEIKLDKPEEKNDEVIYQKIMVKIRIEGGFWEKKFNKDTSLNTIASEFKEANNLEKIKKNHYIDFIYNNSSLQMDSRTLNSIIKEGQKELIIEQEIKKLPGIEKKEIIEPVDFIGKPMYNPFEIYILEIKRKIISKIKYTRKKEEKYELNKYGKNSSYCNGMNHLFISGGTDPFSNNILNMFWDIDLENKEFKQRINMSIPKKNHSMIYLEKKVYIIGGNDESTMYYDINNKNIVEWVKLKKKKFEPSLIKYNNYLFCIDSSRKYLNDYNFEKINLLEENPEWEIVKPQISPDILNLSFSQRFFGLIEDKNENIIFIGGIFDNKIDDDDKGKKEYFNLQYNDDENLIQRSNMILKINDYQDLNLTEKTFLPVDKNTYILFPDFKKRAPKVLYFYKDRNHLEVNSYHSNPKLTKMVNPNNRIVSLGESLKELNFNMPSIKNKNIYLNDKLNPGNFDLEKSKLAPEYKHYIRIHLNNNNNKNNYDIGKNDMKFGINNNIFNKNKENEEEVISEKNDINSNKNTNILKKIPSSDIISDKIKDGDNSNINGNFSDNKIDIRKEDDKDNNINDKNESNIKDELSKKSNKSKDDNDNKSSNKLIDINIDKKSENKELEEKKEEKKEEIKEDDKKENNEEIKEEIKEEKKEEIKEENKEVTIKKNKDNNVEESENLTKKSSIKKSEKSITNIEIFDYDKAYSLVTFHSSVNNSKINNFGVLENNKAVKNNLKLKHFVQPKNIDAKSLKKARRKFNNFEINGFSDSNNY